MHEVLQAERGCLGVFGTNGLLCPGWAGREGPGSAQQDMEGWRCLGAICAPDSVWRDVQTGLHFCCIFSCLHPLCYSWPQSCSTRDRIVFT